MGAAVIPSYSISDRYSTISAVVNKSCFWIKTNLKCLSNSTARPCRVSFMVQPTAIGGDVYYWFFFAHVVFAVCGVFCGVRRCLRRLAGSLYRRQRRRSDVVVACWLTLSKVPPGFRNNSNFNNGHAICRAGGNAIQLRNSEIWWVDLLH